VRGEKCIRKGGNFQVFSLLGLCIDYSIDLYVARRSPFFFMSDADDERGAGDAGGGGSKKRRMSTNC